MAPQLLELQGSGSTYYSFGDNAHELPLQVFRRIHAIGNDGGDEMAQLEKLQASVELARDEIPFLVRFHDPADPLTVEEVDRGNFAASFGSGVSLLRATIEMTKAPVTTGLENYLPWLVKGYPEKLLHEVGQGKPIREVLPVYLLTQDCFWRHQQ